MSAQSKLVAGGDIVGHVCRLHEILDQIFARAESFGYIDLGPHTDLWSRSGLLQPELPFAFRPKRFREQYKKAPFWLTFVGGRASIPIEPTDYAMLIRMIRQADLGWAAQGGHTLIARALIELGEDVNDSDSEGLTPLHWAVSGEEADTVRLLLEHGADPNYPDETGRTPLHLAAVEGIMDLATLLLCAGAEPAIVDDQGDTARDVAQRMGNDELALMLGRLISQQQASALSRLTLPTTDSFSSDQSLADRRRL